MPATRRALIAGLVAAPALLPTLARARTEESPDMVLDSVFAEHAPPAMAGAIVTREGVEWSGVRGVRRAGSGEAATLDDRWHLGSNTKAMTAAVYGRLVDRGLTRWGRPLAEVFPEITADPAWADITVERVMMHRAGLRDDALLPRAVRTAARDDARPIVEQRLERMRAALGAAPTAEVGPFAYANINYVLAGAVIERITGGAWEDAMQAELFGPLGIASGGFGAPAGDQPWGHQTVGEVMTPLDPALKPDNPPLMAPAGTAHMALADYAKFIRLFLTDGDGVLRPETMRMLTTPGTGGGRAYALGWAVTEGLAWARGPVLGHEGSNTLWKAIALIDAAGGAAWIGLSNEATRGGAATTALVQRLASTRMA